MGIEDAGKKGLPGLGRQGIGSCPGHFEGHYSHLSRYCLAHLLSSHQGAVDCEVQAGTGDRVIVSVYCGRYFSKGSRPVEGKMVRAIRKD